MYLLAFRFFLLAPSPCLPHFPPFLSAEGPFFREHMNAVFGQNSGGESVISARVALTRVRRHGHNKPKEQYLGKTEVMGLLYPLSPLSFP